jgi:hypothetical protein
MSSPLYITGKTTDGKILIGGVWTLWQQEGFPVEMSHLACQGRDISIDWLEAMADASTTDNCPALMDLIISFLPADTITHLKISFMRVLASGMTYQQILEKKRSHSLL